MGLPRLWDLIQSFKQECESHGWKTSRNEDWINPDKQFHNFLWAKTIHPSTFKKITSASKCAVREGVNYHIVDVSYTAWLFSEPPPNEIWKTIREDSNLAKRIALYDLSSLNTEEPTCLKLNSTKSKVFTEFEGFLRRKFGAVCRTPGNMLTAEV